MIPGDVLGECRGYLAATGIAMLDELAAHARCYSVARGNSVVRRGDERRGIALVVATGELRVGLVGAPLVDAGGERSLAVGWLRHGDVFDDTRLFSAQPQLVELRAVTPTTVCSIPEDQLGELFRRSPRALTGWVMMTARMLDHALVAAELAVFGSAEQRVLAELRRRAAAAGELLGSGAVRIRRPSDSEMAAITAISRETVCRIRAAMARRGLIVELPHHMLELQPEVMEDE